MAKTMEPPKSAIPTVEIDAIAEASLTMFPTDDKFSGLYKHVETGRMFALAVTPANIYGRTHFLKNNKESWEGTAKAFRETFDKQ